jgi:hypothetical protein
VVVTKDRDFWDGHLLARSPRRLLVVATGNITNDGLLALIETHLDAIIAALGEAEFVELSHGAWRSAGTARALKANARSGTGPGMRPTATREGPKHQAGRVRLESY